MWQRTWRKVDVRWLLAAFGLLLIAGTWTMTMVQLSSSRQAQIEDARRDARGLARLFDEHASRTIVAADQAVIFLRHRYNSLGMALDMVRELREGLGPSDLYNLFTIVDGKADVVLSSKPFKPMNLADRAHIAVHRDGALGDALYISQPVLGRVSQRWSLQLTRRISGPDGTFKGVVVTSLDPSYFTRLYEQIDVGQRGSIALVGADGVVRARRVGGDDSRGQDIGGSAVFATMRRGVQGVFDDAGPIDGRQRIYAYEKLGDYPLYVLVGIDLEERLAGYAAGRVQALTLAAAVTLLIALACAGFIVMTGRLIDSREQAIAASVAKSRFLSNMSHELRTPLNGILGYSELLVEELGEGKQGGFARAVHDCGMRLFGLIESVLELSALESGKTVVELRAEPLAELAQQALAGHTAAAAARQLNLECLLAPQLGAQLVCDRAKLLRVLDILLCNAVAASAPGQVCLRMAPCADGLLVQVADQGEGVPAELRRQIFQKFSPLDDSPSRAKDGAALGLAIAARLVELMGGRIWVEAAAGGPGAIFSFTLPLGRADLASAPAPLAAVAPLEELA